MVVALAFLRSRRRGNISDTASDLTLAILSTRTQKPENSTLRRANRWARTTFGLVQQTAIGPRASRLFSPDSSGPDHRAPAFSVGLDRLLQVLWRP